MSRVRFLASYKSRSGGERHRCFQDGKTGKVSCTCKGFTYAGKCWHVRRNEDRILERGYKL